MKTRTNLLKFLPAVYLLLFGELGAQPVITVSPHHYLQNKRAGIAPSPLFLPGKDNSLLPAGQSHPKLKLPAPSGQTGFAFASCPTPANYAFEHKMPLYFINIGTPEMSVYTDRNFNYNYTDDGECVKPDPSGMLTISIVSPTNTSIKTASTFTLLSSKMDIEKFPAEIFTGNPYYDGLELLDKKFWMCSDQLWIKGANILCGGDSLCIVFLDRNLDGCYTGPEDMIGLEDYGTDSAWTDQFHGIRNLKTGLILGHHGKAFEIISDSENCNSIGIKYRDNMPAPVSLAPGDQLPHFGIRMMSGDSVDIYSLMQPGKFTFIDFWGTWCKGCVMSIPQLQTLDSTLSDSLVLVSVDAYDNETKAKKMVAEKKMNWPQAFSNPTAENLLYAGDGFPYGILIDPDGKIIDFDVPVSRIKRLMKSWTDQK